MNINLLCRSTLFQAAGSGPAGHVTHRGSSVLPERFKFNFFGLPIQKKAKEDQENVAVCIVDGEC